jgi:hypothetical protein
MTKYSTQSLYSSLVLRQQQLSHEIATEFIKKMYEYEIIDEIYFIWWDPTWTLGYGDEFWSLSDMLETLDKDYDIEDVWNYYDYNTEHADQEHRLSLTTFIGMYKWYSGDLSTLYEEYKEIREKNRLYWKSTEGKKKQEDMMKPLIDKFLEEIKTLS